MITGLRVQLKSEIEQQFRKTAMEVFGYSKGSLSKAAELAFSEWSQKIEQVNEQKEGERTNALRGLLKEYSYTSVELQHLAKTMWSKK